MKKTILLSFLLCSLCIHADMLSDLVNGKYNSKAAPTICPMPDGEHYAQLKDGVICSYDFRTGNVADTLFNRANTKLMQIDTVQGFVLSSGGRWMLVYNNRKQIYRRSFEADYYVYDIERRELKPLTADMPVRDPLFSPNSRYIAFSRKNNIYIHKLDFGTEVAVTTNGEPNVALNGIADWLYEEEFSCTSLMEWSADSKQLLFVRLNESEVKQFTYQTMLGNAYPENLSFKYPRAGEDNSVASVVAYDLYYKSLKTMDIDLPDDCYIPRLKATNNPDQMAVFSLNRKQNRMDLWLVNPKSTVSKLTYFEEYKDGYVDYSNIDTFQFLKDNSFIAMNENSGYRQVYLYSPTGLKQKQLTPDGYDVTAVYGFDETTQTLYYQSAQKSPTERHIYLSRKGKEQCLSPESGMHNAIFSADYKYFIDSYSSISEPLQVIVRNNAGKTLRVVEDYSSVKQAFEALELPEKQFTSFTTERGDELNGWILYPTDFDQSKRYPVVQIQYSGPSSQLVYNRWRKDWEYYLASQGYIVVCFDGRGTDCRGRDFRQQTYMNIGPREAQDQVAVAQYMTSQEYVDADRIAIWGWSFGGFMSILAMSQPEKVFKCGIAVAPVTDFRLYDTGYTERFMRRPQENVRGYDECDLTRKVDQLNGRLLIIHGMADDNVHVQNTMKYVEALTAADRQFEMHIYPDDNHFLKHANHYQHVYHRMVEFLQRNL